MLTVRVPSFGNQLWFLAAAGDGGDAPVGGDAPGEHGPPGPRATWLGAGDFSDICMVVVGLFRLAGIGACQVSSTRPVRRTPAP